MTFLNILGIIKSQAGDFSNKRFLTALSYIATIGLCIYSVINKQALDSNIMISLLALSGISTLNYSITNKNEMIQSKGE